MFTTAPICLTAVYCKVELSQCTPKRHMKSQLHSLLTLVLGGSDCPFLNHDHFNPLKSGPVTHQQEALCGPRSSRDALEERKSLPLPGFKKRCILPSANIQIFVCFRQIVNKLNTRGILILYFLLT